MVGFDLMMNEMMNEETYNSMNNFSTNILYY